MPPEIISDAILGYNSIIAIVQTCSQLSASGASIRGCETVDYKCLHTAQKFYFKISSGHSGPVAKCSLASRSAALQQHLLRHFFMLGHANVPTVKEMRPDEL